MKEETKAKLEEIEKLIAQKEEIEKQLENLLTSERFVLVDGTSLGREKHIED